MSETIDTSKVLRWQGEALLALAGFVAAHPQLPEVPWVAEATAGAVCADLRRLNEYRYQSGPVSYAQAAPVLTAWSVALGVPVESRQMDPDLHGPGVFLRRVYAWIGPNESSAIHLYYLHNTRTDPTAAHDTATIGGVA